MQALPNGLGGIFLSTDIVHGMVRQEFKEFGYPAWFPTVVGGADSDDSHEHPSPPLLPRSRFAEPNPLARFAEPNPLAEVTQDIS